jgi:hypothetical protein
VKRLSAFLAAVLGLAGCVTQPDVSQPVVDQIARCSGGIGWSISPQLAVRVARELETRATLSGSLTRTLEGAIFSRVSDDQQQAVYVEYLGCIRGQEEIDALVAGINSKWGPLEMALRRNPRVTPQQVTDLRALHVREAEATRDYRLVEAKQVRKTIILTLAGLDYLLADAYGESPLERPSADGVREPDLRPPTFCSLYAGPYDVCPGRSDPRRRNRS